MLRRRFFPQPRTGRRSVAPAWERESMPRRNHGRARRLSARPRRRNVHAAAAEDGQPRRGVYGDRPGSAAGRGWARRRTPARRTMMVRPVGLRFHSVPADRHHAPPSRTIPRVIVECPMAPPAGLQPLPRTVDLRGKRRCEQTAERPHGAGRNRFEPHRAIPPEADDEARLPGKAVQDRNIRSVRRHSVMCEHQAAEGCPHLQRTPAIGFANARVPPKESPFRQPAAEVGR